MSLVNSRLYFQVKVTPQHSQEAKRLLALMGVPFIEVWSLYMHGLTVLTCIVLMSVQAPCEAEAQCAALVKVGKVYATATEDMDALTFGSSILLRNLTASEAKYAVNSLAYTNSISTCVLMCL